MSTAVTSGRTATRAEVVGLAPKLRSLATAEGLTAPPVDVAGTVIVHSETPGYGAMGRFATAASRLAGVWVNVITDDVPAAEVDATSL